MYRAGWMRTFLQAAALFLQVVAFPPDDGRFKRTVLLVTGGNSFFSSSLAENGRI